MARLAARAKILFYPTPMPLIETIAGNIRSSGPGSILDPCCGTGEQLALLGQKLGLTTYGNELHPERFEIAKTWLDHCLNGPREFLRVKGKFTVTFDNPPYDLEAGGQRMELTHMLADFNLLTSGGLGVWIIPESIINYQLCGLLTSKLSQIALRRFPMPYYEEFGQVVVFGIKRPENAVEGYFEGSELHKIVKAGLPVLQAGEFDYSFSVGGDEITQFQVDLPEAIQVLEDVEARGLHHSDTWQTLFGGNNQTIDQFQPLLPLSAGHMTFVLAAGLIDGVEIEIDSVPHLIKGSSRKRVISTKEIEDSEDATKTTVTEKEKFCKIITTLNLVDGTLREYNSLDDREGYAEFLLRHQEILTRRIKEVYPPLFDPERDMAAWRAQLDRIHAPGKLPGWQGPDKLLAAQEVPVVALATLFQNVAKGAILDGECGTGKTACACALTALIGKETNWKLIVVCPSQVLQKWKREVETVLREFGVRAHIVGEKRRQPNKEGRTIKISRPVLDLMRAMEEPNPRVLIMSYETAKSGSRWKHAPAVQGKLIRRRKLERITTESDSYPYTHTREVEKIVTRMERVLCCPHCGQMLRDEGGPLHYTMEMGKRRRRCTACGTPLWQRIPFEYGGRVAIADLLNRRYKGRYSVVIDESHRVQGADTDAGYASADLISGTIRVLFMTGTLYKGKPSTIYPTLYRLFPAVRHLYQHNEVDKFVEHNGLKETITTTIKPKKDRSNSYDSAYGYTRENVRVRELPGVSPDIVITLLGRTAFLKLSQLGMWLPTYSEKKLPIPIDERLQEGIADLNKIYEKATVLSRQGKPALLSAWMHASLAWVDCPVFDTLHARDTDGDISESFTIRGILSHPDELLSEPLAKDKALLRLVKQELNKDRGVGVFFAQVNRRDWMGRAQKLLAQHGIYSEILRQDTCKPVDREKWYRDFVGRCRRKGQEPVLLANGNLVKEGMDLIELVTLVETGIDYKTTDVRQRDRRSWRITQERAVQVIFLYYLHSWQELALRHLAAKLKAARLVDGDLAEGLAAMVEDDDNLLEALMKAVARSMSSQPILQEENWHGMETFSLEEQDEEGDPLSLQPPGGAQKINFELQLAL